MKPEDPIDPSHRVMSESPKQHEAPLRFGPADEVSWIAAARRGNTEAFRNLVERHQDSAVNLAFRMLRSRPDAEEVAQDAFVRAWKALPEFRGESRFSTWLHRIVVRRALDRVERLKVRSRREVPLENPDERSGISGTDDPETMVLRERLEKAMEALSERERVIITLYYHEDRSVENVAEALDLAVGTVKTLLRRTRAKLRARLAGREEISE